MDFDTAFEKLIGHEGGFQNDTHDRANWTTGKIGIGTLKGTKYGISAMSYPSEDIVNLTLDRAKFLYKRDFWGPVGCDLVPDEVKFDLFDTAVHTSAPGRPVTAIKMLQRALGVTDDGVLGSRTALAISNIHPLRLVARFNGERLDYTNNNREQFARFGVGWTQRIAENLKAV